ncbi:cytochrome P450, partial [Atractiella rhizophila]
LIYLCAIYSALLLYRISPFHPLYCFPGPVAARMNMWWYLPMAVKGTEKWEMQKAHEKYGDWVRIGPNHLSVRNVEALKEIYSHRSNVILTGLLGIRNRSEHSERRRIWERLFTAEGLARFRPILRCKLAELVYNLERRDGMLNLSRWFSFFQVDLMGELSFSGGFTLMQDGEDKQRYLDEIDFLLGFVKPLGHIQWILPLFFLFPQSFVQPRIRRTAEACVKARTRKNAESFQDLYYFLLDEENEGQKGQKRISKFALYDDAALAIIAGKQTTAISLTYIFYTLLRHNWLARLQSEIDNVFQDDDIDDLSLQKLQSFPLLTAVINEALRLNPTVCSGLPREIINTPLVIDGRVIPVGTTVSVPFYSVSRDERYFDRPHEFRPERWLASRPTNEKLDTKASTPFNNGAYSCIGKSLAMEEMKMVIVVLLKRFEFKLPENFDDAMFLKSSKDFLTMSNPKLDVYIKKRFA